MPTNPQAAATHYRHKKRGTTYEVIGVAELQVSADMLCDGSAMVVYRGADGKLWVREEGEFHDGRFEAQPSPEHGRGDVERVALAERDQAVVEALSAQFPELAGHEDEPWFAIGYLQEKLNNTQSEAAIWKERAMELRLADRGGEVAQIAEWLLTAQPAYVSTYGLDDGSGTAFVQTCKGLAEAILRADHKQEAGR